ncbi:HEXXH motif-containing putative peptide modification protein [Streptomyces sp. NK08204]|uniref:aKG-HExxH-type peptide beta-hydroxylase n=1 Tax=Streptomyces sp. NK08204 TaxID=2873260 RepID=UPI001CEC60CD|nr:HEXXH motif-containing putative peptide modification protein [Streptomyces sp. NK08204]
MTADRRTVPSAPPLVLSADLWQRIARGTPDPGTLGLLRTARTGRNLLLLRALHEKLHGEPGWRAAVTLLAEVRRHSPALFGRHLADPAAGAVLAEAVRTALPGSVPALAAVAGHRADLPFRLDAHAHGGGLVLPGLGRARVGAGPATVRRERGADATVVLAPGARIEVPDPPGRPAPGWEPVPRIHLSTGGATLAVRLDPHALPHPGTGRHGPGEPDRWRGRLAAAWELLVTRHPERATAVGATVRAVAPLGAQAYAPGARRPWRSASFSDAFGLVALAPQDDPAELAAALVHETQHSLLYALQDLTRLLDAPPGARGRAPWSDRPRPPSALLQGVCAFLVTAGFWRTEAARGNRAATTPYERSLHIARTAAGELARGDWLTAHGRLLLDAVHDVLAEWDGTDT